MRTIKERVGSADELFRTHGDKVSETLRAAMPGIIQAFNATEQTVTVRPAIRERIRDNNGNTSLVEIPLLVDVPVVFPRAGGFVLTMPVKAGDECLVIFGDMCIDGWWSLGGVQNQLEYRRHDLSDGFAIIGPWSQPRTVSNYSQTAAQLRSEDGNVNVTLAAGELTAQASTVTLRGNTRLLPNGAGIRFTSPNGLYTRTLSLNNEGDPVWS